MCCYSGRRALLRPGVDTPRLCFPYVEPGTLGQDDLSGLLEHTGDRKMAASIAREGTASSRVGTDIGHRLLRGATRCEQPQLPSLTPHGKPDT